MKRANVLRACTLLISMCGMFPALGMPYPVVPDSLLKKDSMNLAILVVDFTTYKFEAGNLSCYAPCRDCDRDSLPFKKTYKPPGDFGSIEFRYTETGELLFGAGIIWMGTGSIYQPDSLLPATHFTQRFEDVPKPANARYFDTGLIPDVYSQAEYVARAENAWASVSSLDIVHEFASGPFRVGFYAWPPTVGGIRWPCTKWIIFLYTGKRDDQGIDDAMMDKELHIYPVPASNEIFLDLPTGLRENPLVSIFNAAGVLVLQNIIPNGPWARISLDGLAPGFYYLTIRNQRINLAKKFQVIRH
jgi:hypothetical protein